ncbi:hypothetical protein BH23ACI1_BH23ACI1_11070 [soil metagenome]
MRTWKTAALVAALTGAAGVGAAVTPAAHGQAARVVAPRGIEIFSAGQGSKLGVSIRDVDDTEPKAGQAAGVLIERVTDGSAADRAGLREGDIVVEFDGERVRSARQLTRLVQESVARRPLAVAVMRTGQRESLTVTLDEGSGFRRLGDDWFEFSDNLRGLRVTPPRPPAAPLPPGRAILPELDSLVWRAGNTLGITIAELSPQLADYFGVKEGVLVSQSMTTRWPRVPG